MSLTFCAIESLSLEMPGGRAFNMAIWEIEEEGVQILHSDSKQRTGEHHLSSSGCTNTLSSWK